MAGFGSDIMTAMEEDNDDWKIINYDKSFNENLSQKHQYRWMGLKTVQFSKAFRKVFGDKAMGSRVRVQIFGQYEITRSWFPYAQFIDDYFNNADGKQHVSDPHPVNYYVWGGGGCTYYSCSNPRGRMSDNPLVDPDLEKPELKPGEAVVRPEGTAWAFTGDGGICDYLPELTTAIKVTAKGKPYKPADQSERVGFKFTVGDKPIYVAMLGVPTPAKKPDRFAPVAAIYSEDGKALCSESKLAGVPDSGGHSWGLPQRVSANLTSRPVQLRLKAGMSYLLLLNPASLGGKVAGSDTALSAAEGITVNGAVRAKYIKRKGVSDIRIVKSGSCGFGSVNFRFTTKPVMTEAGEMSRPPHNEPRGRYVEDVDPGGSQCMYLRQGASVSQEIDFESPGVYAVVFWWTGTAGHNVFDHFPNCYAHLDFALDNEKVGENNLWRAAVGLE